MPQLGRKMLPVMLDGGLAWACRDLKKASAASAALTDPAGPLAWTLGGTNVPDKGEGATDGFAGCRLGIFGPGIVLPAAGLPALAPVPQHHHDSPAQPKRPVPSPAACHGPHDTSWHRWHLDLINFWATGETVAAALAPAKRLCCGTG